MRWNEGHDSPDVIDRRGERAPGLGGAGILALLPLLGRSRFGWIAILVILGLSLVGGLGGIFGGGGGGDTQGVQSQQAAPKSTDKKAQFVGFVLDDTQKTWTEELAKNGKTYTKAKLVLFTDATNTACGYGRAATGPFYCPTDERVYIDLGFYDELERKLGAKGDFAQAYVIAHEIGHHVQNILGTDDRVRGDRSGADSASVRLELQADCYAGVWAASTHERNLLEAGDIDEALGAAAAIGDDRLQKRSGGAVHPETFTHGTSAQRSKWFKRGFEQATMKACDTFGTPVL
jgi:uncharacterized protein